MATKRNPRGKDKFSTQKELKRRKLAPVGVIGDRSPVEHGGGVVYVGPGDEVELHYFQPYDDGTESVSLYRFDVAPDVMAELDWVDWKALAKSADISMEELKAASTGNALARASVYEAVGQHHGFGELDLDPLESTIDVIDRRYDKDVNKAHAARSGNPRGKAARSPVRPGAGERVWLQVSGSKEDDRVAWVVVDGEYVDGYGGCEKWSTCRKNAERSASKYARDLGQTKRPKWHKLPNPRKGVRGKHIACGSKITAKECRQLQHVYESQRARGLSPERAAQSAWGSIDNPRRSELMAQARAARKENGAGLGGFLGSLAGALVGGVTGVPAVAMLLSSAGGAIGARAAAQPDRKERATVGGGVGGIVGPLFAALGGWIAGRKPDSKKRNPKATTTTRRKRNPEENPQQLARRLSAGG